ncbi:MAG TPA: FG-GAP-like repeat-containing protein [Pyrinomonadaceae bacterium]|nr:FG-GAP-like repeat-containing protein [Pyrinomonadaceae bacterium]
MKKLLFVIFTLHLIIISANLCFAAGGEVDPFFLSGSGYNTEVIDADFQADGKLVIGGKFTSIVGFPGKKVARLGLDGHLDFTFNANGTGANGDVLAVKVLPDGKILIGGNFTSYNGTNINRIARLNADGSLDPTFSIGTGASSSVYQIILQPDNKILIGGGFSTVNGFASRVVARLFYDGTVDQSFVFNADLIFNDAVKAIALQADGKILFGGYFFGGISGSISNIARLDSSGNLDATFQGRTNNGLNVNTPVSGIVIRPDGKILIGGQFTTVNGVSKFSIALLNTNGTLDNTFNATSINSLNKFALLSDGRIAIAGSVQIQGQGSSMAIGLLNANGTPDNSFVPDEPTIPSLANKPVITSDNKILACGLLFRTSTLFGGADPAGVRRLNLDGTRDYTYRTKTGASSFPVGRLVVQTSGKIVLRAYDIEPSRTVGGLSRTGLARLNTDGTVDENYAPALNGTAIAALPDDSIIVGGVSENGHNYFRKANPDGTVDQSYSVESSNAGSSFGTVILDMTSQPDGKILAAGAFNTVGGVARKNLVRLNPNGTVDTAFNHNLTFDDGLIRRVILQPDGKMWVSGLFIVGSAGTRALFRLNSSGTAETFTQLANNGDVYVNDVAPLPNGKAYVGGNFTVIGQTPVKYVARLNQDGTVDASFNPAVISGGTNGNTVVYSVYAQPDGKVLIGGDFTSVNGVTRRGFARLNADGSFDSTYNTLVNNISSGAGNVSAMTRQPDGKILLSGYFTEINGLEKRNIARLTAFSKSAFLDFDGDGKTDIGIFRPSVGEWWINRSSSGQTVAAQFGSSTDQPTPADFTGDGKADIAFFRPSSGQWFILRSEDNSFLSFPFGTAGDVPVVGDFDADGKSDVGVFRPSTNEWFISRSSGGTIITTFGISGDVPVAADYDGDGKTDIAIYRPSVGQWWIQRSSSGSVVAAAFGTSSDKPVQGDYSGDGKADIAFFRPSTGEWFILRSEDSSFYSVPFGTSGDLATPGDYDGDGKFDTAVFRPSSVTWFVNRTTAGILIATFGTAGDRPVPNVFVP